MKPKLRPASLSDAEKIENFMLSIPEFHGSIHAQEESKTWKWLFVRKNSIENVLVAEDEDSNIVAHYGMARLPYQINGQQLDAGMICKLAIHEKLRKTPIFMEMSLRLLKTYAATGIKFATGLANRSGLLEFHLAFGFKKIGDVPIYVKPLRFRNIARQVAPRWIYYPLLPLIFWVETAFRAFLRLSATRLDSRIRISPIEAFDQNFGDAGNFLNTEFHYFASRDTETLNWRFFSTPFRHYQVFRVDFQEEFAGYFAVRLMNMKEFKALGIVDLCVNHKKVSVLKSVLRFIDCLAIEQEADLVSMLINGKTLETGLKKSFFLKSPENFALVIHDRKSPISLSKSKIADWFVTWFDHDYV